MYTVVKLYLDTQHNITIWSKILFKKLIYINTQMFSLQ